MWWLSHSTTPQTIHHALELRGHDSSGDCVVIRGTCTCGAWMHLHVGIVAGVKLYTPVGPDLYKASHIPKLVASVVFNNYPPCPAVGLASRSFEEECYK